MDLGKNSDGSVDIYFTTKAPVGFEKNWIPTIPDKGWFAYFRLYGPIEDYFNQSCFLPDVELVQ